MTYKYPKLITFSLMIAMFLAAIEATIVNAAMPTIVGALGGFALYSWVFSAFMLTNTTTVPIYGKLADMFGRKIMLITAILLFITGSALSGFASSMEQLVLYRAIQGLGAGGVLPLALTIAGDMFPLEKRAKVQGLFSSIWGISAIAGPLLGGFIVDHFSWRWLFFINVPIGAFVVLLLALFLPTYNNRKKHKIDVLGATILSSGVVIFLYSTLIVGQLGWLHWKTISLFVLSLTFFIIFVLIEQKVEEPFIPLSLFKNKIIASSNITAFLMGIGMFGSIQFVPLYVQNVIGTSATGAGLSITPQVLGWSAAAFIASPLLLKYGYRLPILLGVFLMTFAGLLLSQLNITTSYWYVLISMFILGLGLGFAMTTFAVAVQSAVTFEQRGLATSTQMFSRSIGATFGVTILGSILTASMRPKVEQFTREHQSVLSPDIIQQLNESQGIIRGEETQFFPSEVVYQMTSFLAESIHNTMLIAFILTFFSLITAWLLIPKGSAHSLSAIEKD